MNMTENANLVESLRRIGFTDTQIADLILSIEGRISLDELEIRFKAAAKEKENS